MKLRQLNIGKQLRMVFASLILVVGLMSLFTIWQTNQLSQQTQTLYDHPLQVRRALDNIKVNQQMMSVAIRDMVLAENEVDSSMAYQRLLLHKSTIPTQIDVLRDLYLGPAADIEGITREYSVWEEVVMRNATMILDGYQTDVLNNIQLGGEITSQARVLEEKIETIDIFANQKADELYQTSELGRRSITLISVLVTAVLILAMIVLSGYLHGNIQRPLQDLVRVIGQVESGVLSARSEISDDSEFGKLADGLNGMLDSIENSVELNKKSAALSGIMLADDDMFTFFQSLLSELLEACKGQLGGIYLLSGDQDRYDLFVSIGMDQGKRMSFDRKSLEGELGIAASTREIQFLTGLDQETRFLFSAAAGSLVPKALITVPLLNQNEVFAFVALGSVTGFDDLAIELLEQEQRVMGTRMQSVLDLQEIKRIRDQLEFQNLELESQKTELDALSLELGEQNRELEQQKLELLEASQLKTHFLSNMSHELRTPLNAVIALSGVLNRRLEDRISDEESQYLEVIGRSGRSLLEMINEILDISRIESGHEEVDVGQFDLRQLIENTVDMVKPMATEKGIDLRQQVLCEAPVLAGDEKKIRHILQNLLSNAIKFTDQGHVDVTAKTDEGHLALTVSDTGIGIAKEHQEAIFEEFRQADSSTTRMYGGTGLGLAIVKRYVELMGGTISLKSDIGKGSEFVVLIPLPAGKGLEDGPQGWADAGRAFDFSAGDSPSARLAPAGDRRHLLIVEDSEPAIVQLREVFSEEGYEISVARDGYEALQSIRARKPDGIVLDLMMPRIDGFEVLKALRANEMTAHIPVLVLSAKYMTREEVSELRHNHIVQLIQKGNVNLEELKATVAAMLKPIAPLEEAAREQELLPAERPLVLVVEDNPDNRLTARAVLQAHYDVIEAEDGEEAVRMAADRVPDLILMDNALPGMDGVEAFRLIRSNQALAHIPVIALTASAMTSDREIFLAYGFDAFVPKPIIEKELLQTIRGALNGV